MIKLKFYRINPDYNTITGEFFREFENLDQLAVYLFRINKSKRYCLSPVGSALNKQEYRSLVNKLRSMEKRSRK